MIYPNPTTRRQKYTLEPVKEKDINVIGIAMRKSWCASPSVQAPINIVESRERRTTSIPHSVSHPHQRHDEALIARCHRPCRVVGPEEADTVRHRM